jgi:dimethylhistidine N-methyltransferase
MGAQIGSGAMLVEYGSGSSVKTRYLLDALPEAVAYVGVDVSEQYVQQAARELARDYPQIEILSVCADFTGGFALPLSKRAATRVVVYFPGSTIGNFLPEQVTELLIRIRQRCGRDGGLLIGIDLKKDPATIEAAYNDRLGVTAQFNLNLLHRINRELGADFNVGCFSHQAIYNCDLGRIEMYLISLDDQVVTIDDQVIELAAKEKICTEYSHKHTVEEFASIAADAGLALNGEWTDENRSFAVLYFRPTESIRVQSKEKQ